MTPVPPAATAAERVFPDIGEMGRLCRTFDWSSTPLGPVDGWPQSLRTAAGLVIGSAFPSIVLWGPELIQVYNDGYIAVHGAKHPWGLGRPTSEVWSEVWHLNEPLFRRAQAGEQVALREAPYSLARRGPHAPPDDVFVDLSFSPVLDESGTVGGVLVTLIDVTAEVETRRLQAERERLLAGEREARRRFEEQAHELEAALQALQAATEQVREREARFRALVEHSADSVFVVDPDGAILYRSPSVTRILGHSRTDPGRASLREWTHPDDRAGLEDVMVAAARQPDQPFTTEARIRHRDGSWRIMEATVTDLSHDPAVGGFVVNSHDVTERRAAERDLRESEERYRLVARATNDVMWDWHFSSGQVIWNDSLGPVFGHHPPGGTTTPEWWTERIHPDDRERVREDIHAVIEGEDDHWSGEYRFHCRDGEYATVLDRGYVMRDASGRAVRMIGSMLDLTERNRTEEALRRSEERYRSFFDNDITADLLSTPSGELIDCNPAFLRIFGFQSVAEAKGCNLTGIYPDAGVRQAIVDRLREERRLEHHQQEMRSRDGAPVYVIENAYGIFDERGELVQIQKYLFDITEYMRVEEQLRQSQKMEAVGQLAGGIAHDFNNMLTAIGGHAELLLEDLAPADPMREDVEEIRAAAQRSADLTRQLLAFSRKQILQPKLLDLNAVVTGMAALLRRLIGEDIELTTRLMRDRVRVHADPGQLEQVLMNLVVNARDAMPHGGTLILETRAVTLDAEYGHAHGLELAPGSYVLLVVSDTGVGMDEGTRARIFEPFFTTKEVGKGTGLGLSTVYGIVKQSGGQVWVYSEPGQGTTFEVYLPAAERHANSQAAEASPAALPGGGETVLLVEDEPSVRSLTARILSRGGYAVLEAGSSVEALAVAERHPGSIHLVLTDVVMPQMSGKAMVERLPRRFRDVPVLFMSGYTDEAIVHHGVLEPDTPFLQKPFTPDALLHEVRQVLREHAAR